MTSLVLTRIPGHRVSRWLFMMPRTVTMPVVESTVFSTIATLPLFGSLLAGNGRDHLGFPACHGIAQIDQHALWNGEGYIDRRHLVDDGKRRGIGWPHEISDLYIGRADPPANGARMMV